MLKIEKFTPKEMFCYSALCILNLEISLRAIVIIFNIFNIVFYNWKNYNFQIHNILGFFEFIYSILKVKKFYTHF